MSLIYMIIGTQIIGTITVCYSSNHNSKVKIHIKPIDDENQGGMKASVTSSGGMHTYTIA